jgi:hypothetical protein
LRGADLCRFNKLALHGLFAPERTCVFLSGQDWR